MKRIALALALLASACSVPEVQYTPIDRSTVVEMKQPVETNVDILFVVDDGPNMLAVQEGLAAAIPAIFDRLETLEGGLPDLHVGVVTTNQGTQTVGGTAGPAMPNCTSNQGALRQGASVSGAFVSDIRFGAQRQTNYTGSLAAVVSDLIRAGATGCPFPQPLLAMRNALRNTTNNAGFLRPGALLAVYFLTNRDDCSAHDADLFDPAETAFGPRTVFRCTRYGVTCNVGGTSPDEMNQLGVKAECRAALAPAKVEPVETFAEYLATVKSVPDRIILGAGIGDPYNVRVDQGSAPAPFVVPACTFTPAGAGIQEVLPGVRLQTFLDLNNDSTTNTACSSNSSQQIGPFADTILRKLGTSCINAELFDADGAPGIQPDCIVEDTRLGDVTPLAPCPAGEGNACWRVLADNIVCPFGANLKLDVTRPSPAANGTVTRARCRLVQR